MAEKNDNEKFPTPDSNSKDDQQAIQPKTSREKSTEPSTKPPEAPQTQTQTGGQVVAINVPFGFENLVSLDMLIVRQEIQWSNVFVGFETNNRYLVGNAANQNLYYAVELNDPFTVNFIGNSRPFDMLLMDALRREVLRIHRPYRPGGFSCFGITQYIEIRSGTGQYLGSVAEEYRPCVAQYAIKNAQDETVLLISGPACQLSFTNTDFAILSADGAHQLGSITRHFPGFFQEVFTKADIFGLTFPPDMDATMKAILLAATFLIDFMHFERKVHGNGHHGNRHRHHYGPQMSINI